MCYYSGCTLKTTAKNFEEPAIASLEHLGYEIEELPTWNCCGTVHSLAADDLMHHLAPIRTLIKVMDQGHEQVLTLCAMCFNTLKQTNQLILNDPIKKERVNAFLNEENDYEGTVSVVHLLELLRDIIGYEELAKSVVRPLAGLRVSAYYGCLLLRPEGIGIDDAESPSIIEDLIEILGGELVENPLKIECCGSYHTVDDIEPVVERTRAILKRSGGADVVAVSCPLCFYNLDYRQKEVMSRDSSFKPVPILYISQLLAIALGLDAALCRFDEHFVDPCDVLVEKGLIGGEDG